jgi:hypothetical protein
MLGLAGLEHQCRADDWQRAGWRYRARTRLACEHGAVNEPVIRVRDLVKQYGQVKAVDGVTFEPARGEILGATPKS